MTDITKHDGQVVVYGEVATNAGSAVAVVCPQFSTKIEGALVTLGNTTTAAAVKTSISELTLTITPASDITGEGEDDVYRIVAWGY